MADIHNFPGRSRAIPMPTRLTLADRLRQAYPDDEQKRRWAAMARQGPALMVWVGETVATVDRDFAIEQLEAALASLRTYTASGIPSDPAAEV